MDFNSIKCSESWIKVEPLNKGWSTDKKFIAIDNKNKKYVLRISDASLYQKKQEQFEFLIKIKSLKIKAPRPIEFGTLNDGSVYIVLSYIEGIDAESYIKTVDDESAYFLGVQAGKMLKRIHNLTIYNKNKTFYESFKNKIHRKIDILNQCEYKLEHKQLLIDYIYSHMDILKDRTCCYTHGDFHLGNMIVSNGEISIIDFDKAKLSDPFDDFKPFCWNVNVSKYFQTGLIDGYFNNIIPKNFFDILSLFAAEQLISHIPWAFNFSKKEIETAINIYNKTMEWYNNFTLNIPLWYVDDAKYPCVNKLIDNQYEYTYIDHQRKIARAILFNEKNEICLLKIYGDDDFGHRDYYETPGGGVKDNELISDAVLREIKEETGCEGIIISNLGLVDDYYNLIHRNNLNYYFLVKVTSFGKQALEETEKKIIKDLIWINIDDAIYLYENMNEEKLEILVKNRELPILLKAKELIKG